MTKAACAMPVPPLGFGVMSKMMLSGRAGSPETPPTAGNELEAARWSEAQEISNAPRDVVVCAGSIATQTDAADELMTLCVKAQAATKDVYAADFVSDHRVGRSAIAR